MTGVADYPLRWDGVLAVEGARTSDGRLLQIGALHWRSDEPLPLMRPQRDSPSPIAGAITMITRVGYLIVASGWITRAGAGSAREFGVGLDTADVDVDEVDWNGEPDPPLLLIRSGRIAGATLTDLPAWDAARITIIRTPLRAEATS
jgi:hypothetical protein